MKHKFPDLTKAMDALEQATANAHAIHSAAFDFIDLAKKHHKVEDIPHLGVQGMLVTGETLLAFQNLMSLTHPK